MTKGHCDGPDMDLASNLSGVGDWLPDSSGGRCEHRQVRDRRSHFTTSDAAMAVGFRSYYIDFFQDYDLHQVLDRLDETIGLRALCFLAFLVGCGAEWTMSRMRRRRPLRERRAMAKGHLGYYQKRRWNGGLRGRFEHKLQLRGLIFMTLWRNTYAMDQEQMN